MCVRRTSYTGLPASNVWFLCKSGGYEQHHTVLFPTIQRYSCFLCRTKKAHLHLPGWCHPRGTDQILGQNSGPKLRSHWRNRPHSNPDSEILPCLKWGKMKSPFKLFLNAEAVHSPSGLKGESSGEVLGEQEKQLVLRFEGGERYCLSTEKASKQTSDPVFTSEDHIDCEVNKKKAQEQGSTGTPRLAVSAVTGLESLSLLSAAPTTLSRRAADRKQQLGYQAVKPVTHRSQNIQLSPSSLLTQIWLQDQGHTTYLMTMLLSQWCPCDLISLPEQIINKGTC